MPKIRLQYIILSLLGIFLILGCNTTKYVSEDRYMLSDVKLDVDSKQINKDELKSYIKQKENLKILWVFKFYLWMYNLSNPQKEKSLLRKIGEPPVIFDEMLKDKSKLQMERYLNNKGYYQAKVSDEVLFKNKKAKIKYIVQPGTPYTIRELTIQTSDTLIYRYVDDAKGESLLNKGDLFDVDLLNKERSRVTEMLQNQGFFRFSEDFIHFNVDTSLMSMQADVEMVISNPIKVSASDSVRHHDRYFVKDYLVYIFKPQKGINTVSIQDLKDSSTIEGYHFIFDEEIPIKEKTILKAIDILPEKIYRRSREERSYNNFYSLRQFKYVNIQFSDHPEVSDSTKKWLRGNIYLPMQLRQNYSIDIEGTNSSGNLGIAGNLNFQNRNLFRGGEILDLNIKGATERQVAIIDKQSKEFVINEFGTTAKLSIPGFIFPIDEKNLRLYSLPFTTFSASYNFQERPDYTRAIFNASFGYQWRKSLYLRHYFNLVDLNAVQIYRLDSASFNSIQDLYIKSSYTDHIISGANYSFIYNTQESRRKIDYHYLRMNFESAGNLLWLLSTLTGMESHTVDDPIPGFSPLYYKIFNTRYAQYLKGDFEYRYGYRFDKFNSIATRSFFGIVIPYGNFNVTPFERRYFTGGANGVRAWQVRNLGPGSYVAGPEEYPNQSADIKIEANVEYRFSLFWRFEGAIFLDAGNVWAINQADNRPGAVFKFNKFYDEFAVGTGIGLRFVTNFFTVRTDLGVKLRDPAQESGLRWIPGNRSYRSSDFNINIAIGYPF
jgi:outer membrane protein assembly factor BamA